MGMFFFIFFFSFLWSIWIINKILLLSLYIIDINGIFSVSKFFIIFRCLFILLYVNILIFINKNVYVKHSLMNFKIEINKFIWLSINLVFKITIDVLFIVCFITSFIMFIDIIFL